MLEPSPVRIADLEAATGMPEGWTALEAYAVVKALDESGIVRLVTFATPGLNEWEAVGMLTAALDTNRDELREAFRSDRDDEEG